eukprot:107350-Chlamydomonas_euryale.AAC.4
MRRWGLGSLAAPRLGLRMPRETHTFGRSLLGLVPVEDIFGAWTGWPQPWLTRASPVPWAGDWAGPCPGPQPGTWALVPGPRLDLGKGQVHPGLGWPGRQPWNPGVMQLSAVLSSACTVPPAPPLQCPSDPPVDAPAARRACRPLQA